MLVLQCDYNIHFKEPMLFRVYGYYYDYKYVIHSVRRLTIDVKRHSGVRAEMVKAALAQCVCEHVVFVGAVPVRLEPTEVNNTSLWHSLISVT